MLAQSSLAPSSPPSSRALLTLTMNFLVFVFDLESVQSRSKQKANPKARLAKIGHIKPPPASNFVVNQFKAPPPSFVAWAITLYRDA